MSSTPLYPGIGTPLHRATAAGSYEVVWAGMRDPTEVIANGQFSVPVSLAAGYNLEITAVYGTAPTTSAFEIYYAATTDTIASAYLLDTVTASSDKTYTFSTVDFVQLGGIVYIKNIGTSDLNQAWLQQKVM